MSFWLKFMISGCSGIGIFVLLLVDGQSFWWAVLAGYMQMFGGLLISVITSLED